MGSKPIRKGVKNLLIDKKVHKLTETFFRYKIDAISQEPIELQNLDSIGHESELKSRFGDQQNPNHGTIYILASSVWRRFAASIS